MVPTLKVPKDSLKSNGFINAYSVDGDRDIQYENSIYLLFLPEDVAKFREFLDNEYERTEAVIEDYDYPDGYVVVVYKLDPYFNKDFNFVRHGQYSKTSQEFQDKFPRVVKIKRNGLHKDEVSLQYRIFNKTEDMIDYWQDKLGIDWDDDFEVWGGFDIKDETLKISSITKNKLV